MLVRDHIYSIARQYYYAKLGTRRCWVHHCQRSDYYNKNVQGVHLILILLLNQKAEEDHKKKIHMSQDIQNCVVYTKCCFVMGLFSLQWTKIQWPDTKRQS